MFNLKSEPRRFAAPLRPSTLLTACLLSLAACGGGGGSGEPPIDPALQEGPHLIEVASGTAVLPRIDFPADVKSGGAERVQAFLAADGRAVVRLQLTQATVASGPLSRRELVYSRSADGTWSAPEALDAPAVPEIWHANESGWVSAGTPDFVELENFGRTDSEAKAMGPGIGQRLRAAQRHQVLPDRVRIGRVIDDQGGVYLIDRQEPTDADNTWTVTQRRVAADGTVGNLQTLSKRGALPLYENRPQLTQNPSPTRAALYWAEPFIATDPADLQVGRLFIESGTLAGSLPTGAPFHRSCPMGLVRSVTPQWGTVLSYPWPDNDGVCRTRVRVIETRAPVTAIGDQRLDPTDSLATPASPPLLSAGPDGQLLALWLKPTFDPYRHELRVATGQVPDRNTTDRNWSWSPASTVEHAGAPVSFSNADISESTIAVGSGGHVAVVHLSASTSSNTNVWLLRYAPGTGWKPPLKLFNGVPFPITRSNLSVAPDGKVLIAYVDMNRCPAGDCPVRLHPRAIVID
ncbi:hypothetical protein [Piscinibacter gummiphilus]|uniref:Uncharacterized protein n=1 Tax=Piscinibacter gummiphilus TaxID=946333 RepID=A0A1W6L4T8_9BURK|nr:hypothetical protein [Piscinibacter gummiphilus]ARN19349.1 hypothetical protein A4W93_05170 [Piscinibacter gummiphilus]ATU64016.1 hypothetical protein CPZ87_05255 [Piscinibacter gummiphilus]GLS93023.1 hypothetical protein GCM10007918_03140 [Piscinibacter gummiphilus]